MKIVNIATIGVAAFAMRNSLERTEWTSVQKTRSNFFKDLLTAGNPPGTEIV
jgi:hypothetical protein